MGFKTVRLLSLFALAASLSACGKGGSPLAWWKSVNEKAKHLQTLEARYQVLEAEHRQLQKEYFRVEAELTERKARDQSQALAKESLAATGSVTGRSPASISYQVPRGLKPEELQALAYEHFREGRFPEAAVTFEKFLTEPECAPLQDAGSMYSAGVAWFQVGNYRKAQEQLNAAREHAAGEEKEKIRKKTELWMRVIDQRLAEKGAKPSPPRRLASVPLVPAVKAPAAHEAHHTPDSHEAKPAQKQDEGHAAPGAHH